ncbi:MAG TPA: hypothetical protein VGO52_10285 [Hyphomonadaceae bacterium]|nr:hypothetical protein [Hyphomonadaceae bacterium]
MQRLPLILGAAAFGALALAAPAQAGCDPKLLNTPAGTAFIYDGKIGEAPARLAIIFRKDGGIEGRYAFATSTAEIPVKGKLAPGSDRFTLTEPGADGKPSATFTGAFSQPVPPSAAVIGIPKPKFYRAPSISPGPVTSPDRAEAFETNCLLISGARQETSGASQDLDFQRNRTLDHPQFGHLYAIAGVADDEILNRRAQAFLQAIADNQREEVVKHFRFPIAFTIGGKFVGIENEKDLLARYDDVFRPDVRKSLARLVPRMMQATEAGIVLAFGIWLDKDGYIISF